MFNWLRQLGRKRKRSQDVSLLRAARAWRRLIEGRFDAAVTNADNVRHWASADGLSADAAASADVRQTLRNRARYEVANNAYAKGSVLTLANDCVGTGPRLQLLTDDAETNRIVETAFGDWAREIDLASKLRTMRMAKATDGEAFAVLTANPELASPIKVDVQLVEADRVANPDVRFITDNAVDRPTVEKTDADFNTLGIQFRGYIDFGVREQDFRGAAKMKGEA